ncbi:MAG: hypothetical protein N4A71_01395 [Carboxylicivirga sp.]|jgi:hypothetical protein|nr:hypothetical protein [Carboxylicivirga sp.]
MKKMKGVAKISDLIEKYAGKVAILEEAIDLNTQKQYFEESRKQKEKLDRDKVMAGKDGLFSPGMDDDQKKALLCQLASIDSVEAFRTIETFKANPDKGLADWAILAFQESKMLIESSLLNEKPLFISTGLGGRDNMLRYFIVLFTKKRRSFTGLQERLLKGEIEFSFKNNNGIIEELVFNDNSVFITGLVPIEIGLKLMLSEIIKQSNEIEEFLSASLLVTNVKKFSLEEVEEIRNKKRKQKK